MTASPIPSVYSNDKADQPEMRGKFINTNACIAYMYNTTEAEPFGEMERRPIEPLSPSGFLTLKNHSSTGPVGMGGGRPFPTYSATPFTNRASHCHPAANGKGWAAACPRLAGVCCRCKGVSRGIGGKEGRGARGGGELVSVMTEAGGSGGEDLTLCGARSGLCGIRM